MAQHLVLTIRLHGDGNGTARYHGMVEGAREWPPAPARVFQALIAGSARGRALSAEVASALEWLEALPPPVIAAPRAAAGQRVSWFVPNNDADALPDPRDLGAIRTKKITHPTFIEEGAALLYSWPIDDAISQVDVILKSAAELYQLGRGIDMAWADGELVDEGQLEARLRAYQGIVHRPEPGGGGRSFACPTPGSLASLIRRYGTARLRPDGKGKSARVLFINSPKPRFRQVAYEASRDRVLFELRDSARDDRLLAWPLNRVVSLVESLRDAAAERLRSSFPDGTDSIEQTLVGRKEDGRDSCPADMRARIVPIPSIGHEHVDRGVRRVLLELPSGAKVSAADIEWAFSGLEAADPDTGKVLPFVVMRAADGEMLRHYTGPSRLWRSVTAVALPDSARRRRIEPGRQRVEAKGGQERRLEEQRAVIAVHHALRHAGIRAIATRVRLQREPFEGNGVRAEVFAPRTRFAKERLWHVELELDRMLQGPLVIGDGRFLGLGLLAPVPSRQRPRFAVISLNVVDGHPGDPLLLARSLRRAVMARAQTELGATSLGRFFTGHEADGEKARSDESNHLAFHWDAPRRRLLIVPPHVIDHREPIGNERRELELLDKVLEGFVELRAGSAGRLMLQRGIVAWDDPVVQASKVWESVTPYAATRHGKDALASELLVRDVQAECQRRHLPRARVTVLSVRGIAGRGLEGRLRLEFGRAVTGPVLLGRARYLGGGLFQRK